METVTLPRSTYEALVEQFERQANRLQELEAREAMRLVQRAQRKQA